jgi:hypothetical protein
MPWGGIASSRNHQLHASATVIAVVQQEGETLMPSEWREHRIEKMEHGPAQVGPINVDLNVNHSEVSALINERFSRPSKRRERWMNDIQMCLDAFRFDCTKVQRELNNMPEQVTMLLGQGAGEIAALRLLELYLPLLATVQRIELNCARVNGGKLWPHDDIRNYAGNLQRVS